MLRRRVGISLVGIVTLGSCRPQGDPPARPTTSLAQPGSGLTIGPKLTSEQVVMGQTVYVPITSSVATADNARPINLAATVTIRNLDQARAIEVSSVEYRDSGGRRVRDHLDRPIRLGPLAALNLFVRESDNSGGPSPSFLVAWAADAEVVPPLVEAVMISTAGAQGITLSSVGRVIASHHR